MGPFDSQKLIATLRKKESDNVLVFGGKCTFKLYYLFETQEVYGTTSYPRNSRAFEILDNQNWVRQTPSPIGLITTPPPIYWP